MGAEGGEDPDHGRCPGIRCNIWARAQRRREITHHLRGGGTHNSGWGALRWQEMIGTVSTASCATSRRKLPISSTFHANDFGSLGLPESASFGLGS